VSTAGSPESLPRILGKVRVLDLTRVVAGPWCTQTLADLGADVLKIERPGEGDDTRKVGPYVTDAQGQATKDSAFFMGSNRGKRSVTVDIATPEGARLVRKLALQCDVFIENYKVGALQKYGLDAASIRALNPRIIYCSVTGFGQDGPYAPRPAYDSVMQAMCGLMSTCGHPDGEPGAGPMRSAVPIAEIFTGLYAAIGILAALMQRDQTGHGPCIDAAIDQDPRFASGMARIKHRRALHDILEARTVQQPVRHWIDRLSPRNVPCAPIYDMQQLFDDPHVRHRGLVMHLPHASGVDVPVLRSPLHLSDAPVQHRAPPMLGGHTDAVLRELLDRSESDIARLRSAGVV